MKVTIDIPDKYLFRWKDLKDKTGYFDMESFIIAAIGIGVQTIDQAVSYIGPKDANIVQFDDSYYWKKTVDK